MFKIQYDLESFKNDLNSIKNKKQLGDWNFTTVGNSDDSYIELTLKNRESGNSGFFEVKENKYFLEFRFFFYNNDDNDQEQDDEEVYSFYHGKLVRFILSKIMKNGEQITILKE